MEIIFSGQHLYVQTSILRDVFLLGQILLKKSHFDPAPRGPEILPVQSALKIVSNSLV